MIASAWKSLTIDLANLQLVIVITMPGKKYTLPVLVFCAILVAFPGKGQDTAFINYLVQRIARQQLQQDAYFLPGIFPSYISQNGKFHTRKKDNNIFFNCLVQYVLNDTRPFIGPSNEKVIDSVFDKSVPFYLKFKNKKRDTYNFWRTDSSFAFPFPTVFNFYQTDVTLPDDMDCTVLALLARGVNDSTAATVHKILQKFVNNKQSRVRSVIPLYDSFPAYSTWLGIKFPVVFDVSVLCNVLSFVQKYNLDWTRADSASLAVIVKTIENDYHITRPIYASPVYPKTSIILYHIARLMKVKKIPELEALKTKLVTDAGVELAKSDNLLEKIMLSSAILKWGYRPPEFALPSIDELENKIEKNNFSFFVANLPSYFKDFLKVIATRKKLGYYDYYCPAFNDALLLEYLVLEKEQATK